MKFLLRLKHWQIFGLTWGLGLVIVILGTPFPAIMVFSFPLTMALFTIGTFGWIWAISSNLNCKLSEGVFLNSRRFKILFSVPIIYLAVVLIGATLVMYGFTAEPTYVILPLVVVLHISSTVIIIYGMLFAARTLRSVELRRKVNFSDYAGEFFLIWFSFVGYWVIQPRLNKLIEE